MKHDVVRCRFVGHDGEDKYTVVCEVGRTVVVAKYLQPQIKD